ncbi:MAG: glycosyltransferase [Planctomycetes bacterium]|nr:glycosyltransferase [Planctomycetota bacterium]
MIELSWTLFALQASGALALIWLLGALARQAATMTAEVELQALERGALAADAPFVTIVVPARNEERNLAPCLETLIALDYPKFEILVIDDESSDATPQVVAEFAARDERIRPVQLATIAVDDRSEFRSGKSFVLAQAARQAKGEWLLFVDADTRQRPDSLWRAMGFCQAKGLEAFSSSGIYPNPSLLGDLLESAILIAVFLSVPLRQVNDPSDRHHGWANGQFVMIRRDVYESIGGHGALRQWSFDDMSLGRLIKEHGIPFRFLPGGALFDCINYVGLREAHDGWVRLVAGGTPWLGMGRSFFVASLLGIFLAVLLPSVLLPLSLTGVLVDVAAGPVRLSYLSGGVLALAILIQAINRGAMKVPIWRAILLPLAALLAGRALWQGYRARFSAGDFMWRGRKLEVDDVSKVSDVVAAHGGPLYPEGA